ncbi:hypothetical protein VTN00DRAFT_1994 [Thermoascus crustaceus]|uniref:uncharacterized protein n=1 Tax=Thermoascus crustaceus TaxID=5088 RepID=UPI003743ECB5
MEKIKIQKPSRLFCPFSSFINLTRLFRASIHRKVDERRPWSSASYVLRDFDIVTWRINGGSMRWIANFRVVVL